MDSSEASLVGDYDVFLSFRGVDTRQGFCDILYEYMTMAEIRTFRDNDELDIGDKIDSILEAISSSKICIPIFSPKFAESKWCLSEVTRMVDLHKTIVPVFYKVSPDDVKLKTSLYTDDLRELEEQQGGNHEEISKWKNALKAAASNKGRELGNNSYTGFCKNLVDEVLSKLGPRKRLEIDHFVGVDNKEAAIRLLDMGSREVVQTGIYGMGGIGKTTIAKFIYNEFLTNFDHCAFVPDIRDFSRSNGVKSLPKHMYNSLEPKPVVAITQSEHIADRLSKRKVLIVLDDVDSCEQIQEIAKDPDWFGAGSRIIVTTRDKNVLEEYAMLQESGNKIRQLEMGELEDGCALELFSRCVFGKDSPPLQYQSFSERVVAYAGGLPMAITVMGKYLRSKRKEELWVEFIKRLDQTSPKEVKDKLLISYEALEDEQKTIFLDIACLFIGEEYTETSKVFHMWQACSLYPRWSLEVLQSRSLVKISKHNELMMHDTLRDLGRDIVRKKSEDDPAKQTRLWADMDEEEVVLMLKHKEKIKRNVEALQIANFELMVEDDDFVSFTHEEFLSFENLRFLELGPLKLQGNFSGLLPKLRWMSCRSIHQSRNLALPNLVVLHIYESEVDESWDGWNQIQGLKMLKVLEFSSCWNLQGTPVFAEKMALERLSFEYCSNLAYIDASIAKLQHLNYMSFNSCRKLKNLPESIGELYSLRNLDLHSTSISSLPDSIGRLEKLEHLNLSFCSSLSNLPQSLWNLRSLVHLNLSGSVITSLPDSVERLKNLEQLHLDYGKKFQTLPNSIGGLEKLKVLQLSKTSVAHLPSTISHLSLLHTLKLRECDQLQELPQLPINLKELEIKSNALNKAPNLSVLQDLTSLKLHGGAIFDWNGSFPGNLQSLTIELLGVPRLPSLSNCSQLVQLKIKCQHSLKVLPNLSTLRKLVMLEIESCQDLIEIFGIGKLKSLASLRIRDCPSLVSLDNLAELHALKEFEMTYCEKFTEIYGVEELRGLNLLRVGQCFVERLKDFGEYKQLKELSLIGSPQLTNTPNLENFQHLTSLHIENCPSLLSLDNLSELQQLKRFKLVGCTKLTETPGLGTLRLLKDVRVEDCGSLERLDNLADLEKLRALNLIGCKELTEIRGIGKLQSLTDLCVKDCPSLLSLEYLGELSQLKGFNLIRCQRLTEIPGLGQLRGLTRVRVEDCDSLERLDNLMELEGLEKLKVIGCNQLAKIPGIGKLKSLASLNIKSCLSLVTLENLRELKELRKFKLICCQRLIEVPGLGGLEGLTVLRVEDCSTLERLDNLAELEELEKLSLVGCRQLTEIPGLGKLQGLVSLYIEKCPSLVNLENLRELKELRHFNLILVEPNKLGILPELPENLNTLHFISSALVKVPNLSRLSNLRDLKLIVSSYWIEKKRIIESSNLQGIVNLTRLESLELRIPNISTLPQDLRSLDGLGSLIITCASFKCIPLFPLSLWSLTLYSYDSKLKLPNLSHMRNLRRLLIAGFTFTSVSQLQLPQSLKGLALVKCQTQSSDALPPLKNLSKLELVQWKELSEISNLGGLESLEILHIECCESLERIENLFELKNLVKMTVCCCPKLDVRPYKFTTTQFTRFLDKQFHDEKEVLEFLKENDLKVSEYLAWLEGSYNKSDSELVMQNDDASDNIVYDGVMAQYDISLLLSSWPERDFLIRNDGSRVEIDRVITFNRGYRLVLLFSASWCLSSQLFTLLLKDNYRDAYADVFIFVSVDEDEESFKNHFSMMPWLAIPFSDSDKRSNLVQLFDVKEIPHLVIFDEHGKVTRTGLHGMISFPLPKFKYPCTREELKKTKELKETSRKNQSLRSLLVRGPLDYVLAFSGRRIPVPELAGKTVGLYFSCKSTSCVKLNIKLSRVYEELKKRGESFEIVVSPQMDEVKLFRNCWKNFFVLPMNLHRYTGLVYHFELRSLPALVIIGCNGETLCSDAVEAVREYGAAAYPYTAEKLAEMDREAVGWKEASWRKQSVLAHGLLEFVLSFDDGRRAQVSELEGKIVGLYFSHCSESCIEFTLELLDVYEKLRAKLETFEIVSVYLHRKASHANQQSFWGSFGTIPWLALQIGLMGAEELISYFEISTLPALVIIGHDGKILHLNAVDAIRKHGDKAYPFTPDTLSQMENAKEVNEEVRKGYMHRAKKLKHHLHVHQLAPTLISQRCHGCDQQGEV